MSTTPKPAGWAPEYAQAFHDEAVARVYHLRPPYPAGLFTTLTELIVDEPRTVLDLGCGPGDLARGLVAAADRVDAVDTSIAMIERGMTLERGRQAYLRWIHGRAEEVPLDPPYALVTAGDSLHWMDWSVVMPRIRGSLTRNGSLAVVGRSWGTGQPEESELLSRYSTNPDVRPLNLIEELESRRLFEKRGERGFSYVWRPTIDEYLGSRHSQASFPRDAAQAQASDRETRSLLERLVEDGRIKMAGERLDLPVSAGVVWGAPAP